jgi:hypothetical protein
MCSVEEKKLPGELYNCCHILYGKSCEEDKEKFSKPLELTYPALFGDIDAEQKLFIENNATKFVLLENANNFPVLMKDIPKFTDNIISKIIEDTEKATGITYKNLGSYGLPIIIKEKYYQDKDAHALVYEDYPNQAKVYEVVLAKIKKYAKSRRIGPDTNAVLHIGGQLVETDVVDDETKGGHFGIIIKKGDKVYVIDSMQPGIPVKKQKSRNPYIAHSLYSAFFLQIAHEVFGIQGEVLPLTRSIQPTGGFVSPKEDMESDSFYYWRLQNMDSQNHFCFFWAVWFFHIFAINGPEYVKDVVEEVFGRENSVDSLVVIKRYIWALVNFLYNTDAKLDALIERAMKEKNYEVRLQKRDIVFLRTFFMLYFRMVWDDLCTGHASMFKMYSVIPCDPTIFRKNFTRITECFLYSVKENNVYVLEE